MGDFASSTDISKLLMHLFLLHHANVLVFYCELSEVEV